MGSVGIGGHINDNDESLFSFDLEAYRVAVRREIEEELKLEGAYEDRVAALINDDSTEVGRVHLESCIWLPLTMPACAPARGRSRI